MPSGIAGKALALQSPGAGVVRDSVATFDPRKLGFAFALHAPWQTGFNNNDLISSITDFSGKTATPTGTARPTFIASGQNSKPILRFNGSSNYLNFGDVLSISAGMVIFLAFKFNSTGSYYQILSRSDGSASANYELVRNNNVSNIYLSGKIGGVGQTAMSGTIAVTTFNSIYGFFNPAGSWSFSNNGVAAGSGTYATPGAMNLQVNERFLVGARSQAVPAYFAAMDLGSLFIGPLALAAYAPQMQAWLKAEWGTP